MKTWLIAIVAWTASESGVPQQLSAQLGETKVTFCSFEEPITYLSRLEGESRALYWKDTVVDNDHFQILVDDGYLGLIDQLMRSSQVQYEPAAASIDIKSTADARKIGTLRESTFRVNVFFIADSRKILLTKWDFVQDGGKICVPEEFINYSEGRVRGTLSLARSRLTTNMSVIWKLRWISEDLNVQFELYVEDELNNDGRPGISSSYIKSLAAQLARN